MALTPPALAAQDREAPWEVLHLQSVSGGGGWVAFSWGTAVAGCSGVEWARWTQGFNQWHEFAEVTLQCLPQQLPASLGISCGSVDLPNQMHHPVRGLQQQQLELPTPNSADCLFIHGVC